MAKTMKKGIQKVVSRISDQVPDVVTDRPKTMAAGAVGVVAAAAGLLVARRRGKAGSGETALHVHPDEAGWVIRKDDAKTPLESFERKCDAVRAARQIAAEQRPSSLIIHGADGKVSRTHTYRVTA